MKLRPGTSVVSKNRGGSKVVILLIGHVKFLMSPGILFGRCHCSAATFVHEDPFELNLEFPEISQDFMAQSEWHLAFNQHMRFPEHITLLEGRGICGFSSS